jgi:multidrug resistance protein, MATE family
MGTDDALTHGAVLRIAVPVMLSNVSTPLIGIVDTAIVGHLPDAAYIGAAAVGGMIFSFVFWGFGFLRMGTTGLTAQAGGARDTQELGSILGRALLVAFVAGVILIALQKPIGEVAFTAVAASPRVDTLARSYFDWRIWSAPAALANYALLGWFIGLGRASIGLVLQLVLNITNVVFDLILVQGVGLDVRGVAIGTSLAELVACIVGLGIAGRHLRRLGARWEWHRILSTAQLKRAMQVNVDIMIRSLALVGAFFWFGTQGARRGDVILGANAILQQFISVGAFFLDGLAFAAEALVGRALGAGQRESLHAAAVLTTGWAAGAAAILTIGFFIVGPWAIDLLTIDVNTRAAAREYLPWAALAPLAGVWAFQLDGIFIGATQTADMRNAMLASLLVFFGAWWLLRPFGNQGLWAAFYVFYAARAVSLLLYYPRLLRRVPAMGEVHA